MRAAGFLGWLAATAAVAACGALLAFQPGPAEPAPVTVERTVPSRLPARPTAQQIVAALAEVEPVDVGYARDAAGRPALCRQYAIEDVDGPVWAGLVCVSLHAER